MKLLILNDGLIFKHGNKYFSDDVFIKFIQHFESYYKKIIVCIPVSDISLKETEKSYKIIFELEEKSIIDIQRTYPYKSVFEYYLKMPVIIFHNLPILLKSIKKADIVLLRVPAMNSLLTAVLAVIYKKPLITYFVGDEKSVVETGDKYRGLQKRLAVITAKFNRVVYKIICHKSRVAFFLSSDLKRQYGNYNIESHFVFTSLVESGDIIKKKRTGLNKKNINLLYVGSLRHEKGAEYLLRAIKILIDDNKKIILHICGDGPKFDMLKTLAAMLKLDRSVLFHGYVPWGRELSEYYLKSDMLVVPSLSEGLPKVLVEAMAKGLPIIATNVGGIKDIIEHGKNGLLIKPESPEEIAEAVELLIDDNKLRKKIIQNEYDFISEHRADKQVKRIVNIINKNIP